MRAVSLQVLQSRGKIWASVSNVPKVFPPHRGVVVPQEMSDLRARAWAGEERSVFLLLERDFHKRHTLIFNKLLFLTTARNRMWTAFPPFIPNRCEDVRAYYNGPAFTPELRLQNCVWRHAKPQTNQKMLLLGADSGGRDGPTLARGSVLGIQARGPRAARWYVGTGLLVSPAAYLVPNQTKIPLV